MMDDVDNDYKYFMTPSLTPHVSENSTSEYCDLANSFSQKEYLRRLSNISNDLDEVAKICCQLDDNHIESDVQDQQPTEATDDSNDASQSQPIKVHTIDDSLHLQSSEEQHGDNLSVLQEAVPVEESYATIVSDTETIQIEERHQRQVLNYSPSLCVPYTDKEDEQDEISVIKETVTTTTSTISLEFTSLEKKDKNNLGHIMISYNHSTKAICSRIAKYLKNRNYIVWIDQDNISGDILTSMASAVENSFVVLMAINEQYYQSRYCRLEAEYSVEQNIPSIPLIMQAGYKPLGWLGIINGSKLHIDFSQLPFEEAFKLLLREIEAVRISLGADVNDQTVAIPVNNHLTTTTSSSWSHISNVNEWSADDVTEWLNREKLEIFEEGLRGFTGVTLAQLYKIKHESPTDYYRMIETLLPNTIPLRLVQNLKFYAALDSLFTSSIQTMHR